ncbi:hypothetical protein B296_00042447 [Ensete ventricosum]|uniref:Ubiquitin-like domain-containing protein n=1 Tax=Ensete ventricosum TaxID=4639 RepID=A0A426XDF8_ENSVE|nr:hypothetical protein B296_00042447 [Ensete ventricosum]
MIEVVLNDRLGKKVRAKCNADDTIGDLKKLVPTRSASRSGTPSTRITSPLRTTEIHDGMALELYYN